MVRHMLFIKAFRACVVCCALLPLAACASILAQNGLVFSVPEASGDYTPKIPPDNRARLLPVDAYREGPARSRAASVPESISKAVRDNPDASLPRLVKYLTADIKDPFEVARVLHVGSTAEWRELTPTVSGTSYEFDLTTPASGSLSFFGKPPGAKDEQYLVTYGITSTAPARTRAETEITPSRKPGAYAADDAFACSFTSPRKVLLTCRLVEEKSKDGMAYQLLQECTHAIICAVERGAEARIWFPAAGEYTVRIDADADGYARTFDYHVTVRKGTTREEFWKIAVDHFFPADDANGLDAMMRASPWVTGDVRSFTANGRFDHRSTLWKLIFDPPLKDGRTLLQAASAEGKAALAALCLDSGVDPDKADAKGMTPLLLAAQAGREDLVRLLLARKADPRVKDPLGRTAIDYAPTEAIKALLRKK